MMRPEIPGPHSDIPGTRSDEEAPVEYAELHAHTNFSLLDGTSDPEDMVARAVALGLRALAITDHDSVAGIVRFAAAAKRHGVHAIIGAELTVAAPGAGGTTYHHLTVLAENLAGYQNLCRLLTLAYQEGGKDHPCVPFDALARHSAGLVALSGCPRGELPQALAGGGHAAAVEVAGRFKEVFGAGGYYVELGQHLLQGDGPRNAGLRAVAEDVGLGCVATNDVHYHDPGRALLHHVVTCIRHGTTLEAAGNLLRGNDTYYLKSPAQMARLFAREVRWAAEEGRPELDPIRTTLVIAERCTFSLKDLCYEFPRPHLPSGESDFSFLVRMVEAGKALFYPKADPEVEQRLANELALVRQMNLAGYLLVFKEVVDWSHEQNILCSIRGSAPASALLYCLGLCPIDPVKHGLIFERFCSPEREEYPDIDLDFAHERREEVIQHVYDKYGRDRAAMVCEVNTYRVKSALRDVAKVLGLSAQRAQQLADQVEWHDVDPRDRIVKEDSGEGKQREGSDPRIGGRLAELLLTLSQQLRHSPRHRSIHVGGMVISSRPLNEVAPIEPARMPNRTILPWDKDDLTLLAEEFGIQLIKMDLLGLGMLSLVSRCFDYVHALTGHRPRLHGFSYPKEAFDVLCAADTVGLFQVESRAQQSFLPRLKPRNLSEVAISVGAIRPGPGAAQAGEHIVRRRQGKEDVTYPAEALRPALEETYGVLLWQEQCIQVVVIAGGYTPGEADQLRRAMSHKRSYERMNEVCEELVVRMVAKGYTPEMAEMVRKMIVGFAGYGFPRAHAYPFAHLALISATLRLRYPTAYYAAILNCQPMGFYAPHTLIWDAHRHGVRVLPVDVNRSDWECTLEEAPSPPTPLPPGERGAWADHRPAAPPRGEEGAWADHQPTPPPSWWGRGPGGEGEHPVALRLGFKEVQGLGSAAQAVLKRERARGRFVSHADFVTRTEFDRDTLERLAEVGAFLSLAPPVALAAVAPDSSAPSPLAVSALPDSAPPSKVPIPAGRGRRADVWAAGELAGFTQRHLPGLAEQLAEGADLPPMSDWEEVQADYRALGYSIGRHVVAYFRPRLKKWGALTAEELPDPRYARRGLVVRAGGMVIVRQRPETASNLLFMTLEDETGLLNAIVYPSTYERLRRVLRGEPLIVLEGPLQKQDSVTHILVRRAWPLVQAASVPRVPSHDFH